MMIFIIEQTLKKALRYAGFKKALSLTTVFIVKLLFTIIILSGS